MIIISLQSEYQFIHLPLLYLEMSVLSSTEHLSAACAQRVVAVVEALGEVRATVAMVGCFVGNLQVRIAERGSEGLAAPNSFFLVHKRVSLA